MQTQQLQPPLQEAPTPATPPAPSPPRSPLGRLTISLAFLATGLLGIVDLSGADVAGSAYFAVAVSVVGLGLLAGVWYGRAHYLIVIGFVLTCLLAIAAAAEAIGSANPGAVTWRPGSVDQIQTTYQVDLGNATLDLTGVNFAGQDRSIRVEVGAGNLTIIVPSDVDTRVEATVDVGNANVLGTQWNGIGQSGRSVVDNGADGLGGGQLTINAFVDVGNLEVRR